MAKVFPDGWRELAATGSAGRELQTLGQLAGGLDDQYTVYHGVHWTRVDRSNFAIVGEIDFAVVGPTGKVLLIEQKTGLLTETAGGLTKKYADKDKGVPFQMARSADALHERLRKFCKGERAYPVGAHDDEIWHGASRPSAPAEVSRLSHGISTSV